MASIKRSMPCTKALSSVLDLSRSAATQDTEARIAAGVDILNVSAASETPQLVAALRARHPEIPIIATGGPKDETIRKTIAAGANAITYTPPDNGVLLAEIMHAHRERYR